MWLLLLAIVGLLTLLPGVPGCDKSAPEATEPATAGEEGSKKSAAEEAFAEHEFGKLIPDMKVPVGAQPTVIDLQGRFEATEFARGCDPKCLELDVVRIDPSGVADVVLEGDQLTLRWLAKKEKKAEVTIRLYDRTDPENVRVLDSKFEAQVWEANIGKLLLTVVGGLGIFLLGMKSMSEGLQAVAGAGLRRMIGAVTENRLMATGVGTLVTCLIQSSSITTVMVVGFVNSGFMTLAQAVGVIMGANIGTTITGWILALKIGKYGLPILGVAAFVYLFSKRDRLRFVAMAVMGLGMVFFGLELMKDGFSIVKSLPEFEAWFKSFDASTYRGVLMCAAVGCVVTLVVQSSSATLGITIGLAVTNVISIPTACALVLGENVGTTITALLASLGATTNARRAAYFHALFNVLGVAWITAIFTFIYFPFIEWLVPALAPILPGIEVGPEAMIATTHTVFNVVNMLLFLPFSRRIAGLLERVGRREPRDEKPHLTSLDVRMLETSAIAIEQSRVEILRMAFGCEKLAGWLKEILSQEAPDQKTVQKAFHREEVLDQVQDEIVGFIAHLLSGNIPLELAEEARRQLRMADEYESVGDYLTNILKSHLKLDHSGLRLPQSDMEGILQLHDMVAEYLALIGRGYERRQPEVITMARSQGEAITHRVKEMRNQFLARMSEEKLDPQLVVAYNSQINAYRRVREHVLNVAEAIAGEK